MRVLLAEDDDAYASLTEALLAGEQRIELVGRARDGVEAVALATSLAPDLVLMDVAMPELDGIEATARIRRDHPGVRVLMLSSSRLVRDVEAAAAAGAAGFVRKERMGVELVGAIIAAVGDPHAGA